MLVRVCFVCLGNICRSPTAEATMRRLVHVEQLTARIEMDSAGTGDWHVGDPPDRRARAAGKRRGIDVRGRARKVRTEDFDEFDYLVAMDQSNLEDLRRLAPHEEGRRKVTLLRNFDPDSPPGAEVPDPYYGDGDGFETVLDICESACRGLLQHIRERHRI
ncbi:MAG: low molecular weight protein-tyrosine-phosphatase [Polyangiales bacterium]